jgi:hypothetical protein
MRLPVDRLYPLLRDEDPLVRRAAAERAAPDLVALLVDDPDLRLRFIVADRAPREAAIRLVNDEDEEVARRARERRDENDLS